VTAGEDRRHAHDQPGEDVPVGVGQGRQLRRRVRQHVPGERLSDRQEEAVDGAAHDGALPSAEGVAEHAGAAAGEEEHDHRRHEDEPPGRGEHALSTRNTTVDAKKPSITAVGANGKTVGTSRAGRAPGISFSLMPLKAGTISARNMRTPKSRTAMPAAKRSADTMPHTHGLMSGSKVAACSARTAESANAIATRVMIPMTSAVETLTSLKNDTWRGSCSFSVSSCSLSPTAGPTLPAM